jgi:GntR family transcriptional regulator
MATRNAGTYAFHTLQAAQPGAGPLHTQLTATLRAVIQTGQAPPGTPLPGELQLAAQLAVSRHTVRHALGALVQEGLLRRERGSGTVVAAARPQMTERRLERFYAFAWEQRERGAEHRSDILERAELNADAECAKQLRLPIGAPVERITRLRSADGEPLLMETAWLPRELSAGLNRHILERGSLYDYFEQVHGLRVSRANERLQPIALDRQMAQLLGVPAGSAAFLVERVTWSGERPLEWQRSTIRSDRYVYSVELVHPS